LIELEFRVRWYQRAFHEALVQRQYDRLMAVWHRRAGKDEIVLSAIAELSEKEIGTYWHCFPEYKQARKAIWNGINPHTGKRRIFDHFPEPVIKRMQDDDMFIELASGSTFQLLGSDRYDATVGSGPRGIAYSEWALANPSAWAYHAPMLRENKGWAAFITTPRGDNHAKTMFEVAQKSDSWFAQLLSITDTEALSGSRPERSPAGISGALWHRHGPRYLRAGISVQLLGCDCGGILRRRDASGRTRRQDQERSD
jgi:phage terminase large subunit